MLSNVKPANKWPQVSEGGGVSIFAGPNACLPWKPLCFQCLCIAPTYELALQIGQVLEQMGKFCPEVQLKYAVRGNRRACGSLSVSLEGFFCQNQSSEPGCVLSVARGTKVQEQMVVGTPGTVYDWCAKQKALDPKKITMFVLDEADVMISMQGHRDQSIRIKRWVLLTFLLVGCPALGPSSLPPPPPPPFRLLAEDCQMLFFSATFEDSVWEFAQVIIPEPNIIRLKREEETLDNIRQFYIMCESKEEKFSALCNLYGCLTIAQTIVFCQVGPQSCRTRLFTAKRVPASDPARLENIGVQVKRI